MHVAMIPTHRGRLRVERHHVGAGPGLLCLHGLGSSCAAFHALAAETPKRELIVPDLIGFGASDRPHDFDYSICGHAAAVAEALTALGVERCDVLGHSMGGTIALALAALFPSIPQQLVVAEPNLVPGGGITSTRALSYTETAYAERGLHRIFDDLKPGPQAPSSQQQYWKSLAAADPVAMHRSSLQLVTLSEFDAMQLLGRAAGLIAGAQSGDVSAELAQSAGMRVEVVQDAGHDMFGDNPQGSLPALQALLAS